VTDDLAVQSSEPGGTPSRKERTAARMADLGMISSPLEELGGLVHFTVRVVRDLPTTIRIYPGEVARQCGMLIKSNALVVLFMLFMLGALCGLTGTFLFESIGLESYVAVIPAVPLLRGLAQIVFGWVLAAKAGCGNVAELGAMRISEEIDAMDVMGVQSLLFLVGTRVAAAIIVIPALWVSGVGVFYLASKLFFVDLLQTVSNGGFNYILFLFQSPRDFIIAMAWCIVLGFLITVVSCYYGYNASGGPVGVGRATAQSMLVNLILVSVVSMVFANLFYAHVLNEAIGT